jgi:hypothetical protein
MLGHVMGIPVEESVLQFASAGAAFTVAAVAGRTSLARLVDRILALTDLREGKRRR